MLNIFRTTEKANTHLNWVRLLLILPLLPIVNSHVYTRSKNIELVGSIILDKSWNSSCEGRARALDSRSLCTIQYSNMFLLTFGII